MKINKKEKELINRTLKEFGDRLVNWAHTRSGVIIHDDIVFNIRMIQHELEDK